MKVAITMAAPSPRPSPEGKGDFERAPGATFILSYARADKGWMGEFAATLEDAGIRAWSESDIEAGRDWKNRIEDALRSRSTLVLILAPDNLDNPWTYFEGGAAVADHKQIIPVFVQDIQSGEVPTLLKRFQLLKEHSPAKAGRRVAEAVERIAA